MNDAQRILTRQTSRANAITGAVTDHYTQRTLRRVRALVEDSGGRWSRDVARVARAKVRSTLIDEAHVRHVIQYHATDAAVNWSGDTADRALRRAVRRASGAIGTLVDQMATLGACRLLVETAGLPGMLTPDAADALRARL